MMYTYHASNWKHGASEFSDNANKRLSKRYMVMAETADEKYVVVYNQWDMGLKYKVREKRPSGFYDELPQHSADTLAHAMSNVENAYYMQWR